MKKVLFLSLFLIAMNLKAYSQHNSSIIDYNYNPRNTVYNVYNNPFLFDDKIKETEMFGFKRYNTFYYTDNKVLYLHGYRVSGREERVLTFGYLRITLNIKYYIGRILVMEENHYPTYIRRIIYNDNFFYAIQR